MEKWREEVKGLMMHYITVKAYNFFIPCKYIRLLFKLYQYTSTSKNITVYDYSYLSN